MSQPDRSEPAEEGTYSFDVVIRGYDRMQVEALFERLGKEMDALRADRDALADRADKLTEQLAAKSGEAEALTQAPPPAETNFQSMGARISTLLRLAEEEAADIRRVAQEEQAQARTVIESSTEECAALRNEAREEAERVAKQAFDNAQRVREEAENKAATVLAEAQRQGDQLTVQAREAVQRAEAQSTSRMAKVEEDFDLSLTARKAEAARIDQERDQASRHEVNARLEQARAEAENMIASAEQRVAELEAQQLDVSSWLDHLRQALSTVPVVDLPEREWPIDDDDRSTTGRHGPPQATPDPQPDGSDGSPAIPAEDPVPEAEYARSDGTVLAREDILEYRHMRRSRR